MSREIESNNKNIIKKIILSILISIIIILIPFILVFILHSLFPTADGYLLMGFSFYVFISFFIWIIPISTIILIILEIKENKGKISIKDYLKKEYGFGVVYIIFIILGSLSLWESYKYYKDIKNYPQEAIMLDVTIEKRSGKYNKGYFITGYIDGKKTKLQLIRDAKTDGRYIRSARKVKIYYYKNIKEVYEIKYWY